MLTRWKVKMYPSSTLYNRVISSFRFCVFGYYDARKKIESIFNRAHFIFSTPAVSPSHTQRASSGRCFRFLLSDNISYKYKISFRLFSQNKCIVYAQFLAPTLRFMYFVLTALRTWNFALEQPTGKLFTSPDERYVFFLLLMKIDNRQLSCFVFFILIKQDHM